MQDEKKESDRNTGYLIGTLIVSLVIAIGIFMLLPAFIANLLYKVTDSSLWLILLKVFFRLAYIYWLCCAYIIYGRY